MSENENKTLFIEGKWANADLYKFEEDGVLYIRKTFENRLFFIRWSIGVMATWRESKALKQLNNVPNIPKLKKNNSFYALDYEFITGRPLSELQKANKRNKNGKKELLPESFFIEAEQLLDNIHTQHIFHADLRRAANWLITEENKPAIIDFQSAFSVSLFPKAIQRNFYDIDISGLYKLWGKLCKSELPPERKALTERHKKFRKLWVFKGYPIKNLLKRLRQK